MHLPCKLHAFYPAEQVPQSRSPCAHVLVQLYDGRVFPGIVKAIHDTIAGRKVAVQHEYMAWRARRSANSSHGPQVAPKIERRKQNP